MRYPRLGRWFGCCPRIETRRRPGLARRFLAAWEERGARCGRSWEPPGPALTECTAPAGDVQVPGPPTNVHVSEISRTYVVLSWDPPAPRGKEPLMYFIEKVPCAPVVRSCRSPWDLSLGHPCAPNTSVC